MQIVRHRTLTLEHFTQPAEVLLRSLGAESDDGPVKGANSALLNHASITLELGIRRHFDLSDTVSDASLIPVPKLHSPTLAVNIVAPAFATHENLHHAAHRRSESRIGSDLLTLIRSKRFRGRREQLDPVLALHVGPRIVAEERGLRAHSIRLGTATNDVVIHAAHDRVREGANGDETRIERSLAHGYQYTRRGRTLQTLLF